MKPRAVNLLASAVFCESERRLAQTCGSRSAGAALAIFSAKESIFKAFYELRRERLALNDIVLSGAESNGELSLLQARLRTASGELSNATVVVEYLALSEQDYVVTGVALSA